MSVPEYVFLHRVQEFYDQLRLGHNLWKIDEVLNFVDDRGREMVKRWIQDERFPWTFGRGYTLLTQPAPIIALVVDSDSDRAGGYFLGNHAGQGIEYDPTGTNPQMYWEENARLKTGSFVFVLTAPNSDMLTAMYCLLERALYEGETPPAGEQNIISFSDYGISELRYSGSDLRPDQNYIPTATFARTLRVSCTYMHTWSGKIWGPNGYAFSIDLGNLFVDETAEQTNPNFIAGNPVLPIKESLVFSNIPGAVLSGSTESASSSTVLTSNASFPAADNIIVVPPNSAITFNATIGANINGEASALWRFSGVVRREADPSTVTLVGITSYDVVADEIFSTTYVDIYTDTQYGALIFAVKGINLVTIKWQATVQIKELP